MLVQKRGTGHSPVIRQLHKSTFRHVEWCKRVKRGDNSKFWNIYQIQKAETDAQNVAIVLIWILAHLALCIVCWIFELFLYHFYSIIMQSQSWFSTKFHFQFWYRESSWTRISFTNKWLGHVKTLSESFKAEWTFECLDNLEWKSGKWSSLYM